jgi:riboflavin-specific deaminase-like protein
MPETRLVRGADHLYEWIRFPEFAGRPFVAANMVSSVDGRAAVAGSVRSIGSPLDRVLMRRLRASVDCVLVGAATLRAEGYDASVGPEESAERARGGLPPQPLAAVVTASGDLPLRRGFFRVPGQKVVVLTSARAVASRGKHFEALREIADVAVVADGQEDPAAGAILEMLHRRFGVRRLLLEGGPRTVGRFFVDGLVDELFLTISPKVVGGDERSIVDTPTSLSPPSQLILISAAAEAGYLFLRYTVHRSSVT